MKQAVILAGGMGTRLRERLGDLPKPMIPIGGRPLIEHQLALCQRHGFLDVWILAAYRAETIKQFVGDGRRWGVRVQYRVEDERLGTAGAVMQALPSLAVQLVVLYGDEMVNVDLDRFWQAHQALQADASLLLHPNDHPFDSDLVEVDPAGWIRVFHPRPHPPDRFYQNLVNAALYVVNRDSLRPWAGAAPPRDFGRDLFPAMLAGGRRLQGYRSPEYIKDIGTPARYDRVCAEYEAGVVQRGTLRHPQVAVFLDRDGTLNEETGGVTAPEQLKLLPGVAEAVRALNHHGIRAVVVTNQPFAAKGLCTEAELDRIHNKLETLLGREHAFLDRIYYCPHHPDRGFAGERPDLKVACECRKPKPGLIHRAVRELNIDLARSWLVGDSTVDLAMARNCGLRAILVRTGHAGRDGRHAAVPDFVFDNLREAVHFIGERTRHTP